MTDDLLIELACSAHRARDADGAIRWSEAWHDLSAADRLAAWERTVTSRRLEAALDPQGLSTTARAVLDRIRRG